jgi:hypothetical protein
MYPNPNRVNLRISTSSTCPPCIPFAQGCPVWECSIYNVLNDLALKCLTPHIDQRLSGNPHELFPQPQFHLVLEQRRGKFQDILAQLIRQNAPRIGKCFPIFGKRPYRPTLILDYTLDRGCRHLPRQSPHLQISPFSFIGILIQASVDANFIEKLVEFWVHFLLI